MASKGWTCVCLVFWAAAEGIFGDSRWQNITTSPTGVLTSINYNSGTKLYPNNNVQRWTITTSSPSKFLQLQIVEASIEGYSQAACTSYDYLLIAPSSLTPKFGSLCSKSNAGLSALYCNNHEPSFPKFLYTGTNSVVIEFCSDVLIQSHGFELIWTTVDAPPVTTTTAKPGPPTPPPPPPKSCPLPPSALSVSLGPGASVNVSSPGYPTAAYPSNLNCTWTITASNGLIDWDPLFFDVEIKFTSPAAPTPPPTLPPIGTPCNEDLDLTDPTTKLSLYSPGWPNAYSNGLSCSWRITNAQFVNKYDVQFYMTYFNTEEGVDQLHIFPFEGENYALDGNLTGQTQLYEASVMYLLFDTDTSITKKGFHISISLVKRPFECNSGQFKCVTGDQCVPGPKRCDGTNDCADQSDEARPFCNMPTVCGTQSVVPNIVTSASSDPFPEYIVNGTIAKPGTWPWTVTIHYHNKYRQDGEYCGGTLISPSWVVTAAHCVFDDLEPRDYRALVGSWSDVSQDAPFEHDSAIEKIFYNPLYNATTTSHDVALLKLANPVPYPFNAHTNVACLPAFGAALPAAGTKCVVSGWGVTEGTGSDTVLRQAVVQIIDPAVCHNDYIKYGTDGTMFCAGYQAGQIDTCSGDSGGPLVCHDAASNTWVLTGITSWGEGCAEPGFPGVYSKVSALIDWVHNAINMYD